MTSNLTSPLFSVIIPTYNRLELLKANLASVRDQIFSDFEIIVVDDGSTDGTREYLATVEDMVTALFQENKGPGPARNKGAQVAKGKYLAFLDSDDLWFPWSLQVYADTMQNEGDPELIVGSAFSFSDPASLAKVSREDFQSANAADFLSLASKLDSNVINSCSAVVLKKAVFDDVGGFAQRSFNGEDSDLWIRCSTADRISFIQSPRTFAYREHEGSAVSDLTKTYEGMMYLISQEKGGNYPGGSRRKIERLKLISRHLRAASFSLLEAGSHKKAWDLFCGSLFWNLRLMRIRYLGGFVIRLITKMPLCLRR